MEGERLNKLCDKFKWLQVRDYLNSNEKKERKKAAIEWKNKDGVNSFYYACRWNAPIDIIQKMIDIAGDDIVFGIGVGNTPLHLASNKKAIVELLISTGGRRLILMQNKIGDTALHWACSWTDIDNSEVVKLLVQCGGSKLTKIRDNKGQTASEVKEGRYKQVIQYTLNTLSDDPSQFYENFDDIRNLVNTTFRYENQTITIMPHINNAYNEMTDFLQFKLLLTAVNAFHRLQTISNQDRVDLIHKMLLKAKNWCTSPFNTATYRVILKHIRKQNIIHDFQQFGLEAAAIETQISNADFIKEMQHMIANNTRRINNMEQVQIATIQSLHQLSESINEVQHNVEMVHEGFSKFIAGYEYKKRVEAGCDLVSAVLNAFSLGIFGSAAKGIMGMTMASIVDFSDLVHVKEIATSINVPKLGFMSSSLAPSLNFSDMTLKESFDLGLELAKDNLGDKRIDEAVKYHNSMVLISASAAIFSFKVDNNDEEENIALVNDHESSTNDLDPFLSDFSGPSSLSSPLTFADRLRHLETQLGLSNDTISSTRSRLHTLEVDLFGEVQEGTLISRIEKLEENIL